MAGYSVKLPPVFAALVGRKFRNQPSNVLPHDPSAAREGHYLPPEDRVRIWR